MNRTKVIKSKKKSKTNIVDDNDDDNDDVENSFKILNKKVLKIQNINIKNITNSFIRNDGYVSLSVY